MTDLSAKRGSHFLTSLISRLQQHHCQFSFPSSLPLPGSWITPTKAVVSQMKATLFRKLALVIHQVNLLHTSCCHPALFIPLLSGSPKDTLILFSFAPHKTGYSHLKWGSETEEHTRNGFKLTLTTNWQSKLKFCFTEILFYFHLLTNLFNSVVCCLLTAKTSTKTPLFFLYRCILCDS